MEESLLQTTNTDKDGESLAIPSWNDVSSLYESRWLKEKEKFQTQLRHNFKALVELFESGYAPHVGDVERLAGKKARRLYITRPHNYAD